MNRYFSVFGLIFPLVTGCDWAPACQNETIEVSSAPGGARKAVLFERNCGATTGFSSQVSILKADEKLAGSGNTFIADTGHETAPAAAWGGPKVELNWLSMKELLITYDGRARVFVKKTRMSGVTVKYRILKH